jgi:hypothetical protein
MRKSCREGRGKEYSLGKHAGQSPLPTLHSASKCKEESHNRAHKPTHTVPRKICRLFFKVPLRNCRLAKSLELNLATGMGFWMMELCAKKSVQGRSIKSIKQQKKINK